VTADPSLLALGALCDALQSGATTPDAALDACLARVRALDPKVKAFLRVTEGGEHGARAQAAAATSRRKAGAPLSPLDGVPVALKDIFCQRGVETTCGSKILEGWVSPYSATVVQRLEAAGAVLVGKLNMDEFAMGSSTENSAFGPTHNPWDLARTPGGSSGGSAAAVAARLVPGAFGTDTGGSIRQPAALVGCVGLKPTYGRVSRYGVVAFASSLDQPGPLAQDVRGCALLLQAVSGRDDRDQTSSARAVPDFGAAAQAPDVRGLKLGLPAEYFGEGLDFEVEAAVRQTVRVFEEAGARVVPVSLPNSPHAVATYYLVATAEASSNLARYDGVRFGLRKGGEKSLAQMYGETRDAGFGAEVKRRIMLGTFALSSGYYDAYYLKAQKVRQLIYQDFAKVFTEVDAVLSPTTPTAAFRLGEKTDDPLAMYLSDIYTVPANLAGLPALSAPAGFTKAGLPIGYQLIGRAWEEATLLRLAAAHEARTDWHLRVPALG
jgi:aspartyl-tRNA(Asn)/glutamyl-tRNA(Gln) amidotransferase subunit A